MSRRYPFPFLTVLGLSTLIAAFGASARAQAPRDTFSDTWVATDSQGRTLPTAKDAGPPKANKTVGIFYFLWEQNNPKDNVFDNTKLIAADPADPKYGGVSAFHWWAEPKLGYYAMDDPYIIAKHAQQLTDAGVDVIICDVTNAFTYTPTYMTIFKVYDDIRKHGGKTPQIAFITNARSGQIVQKLYDELYSKNLYPDLWYRWRGKPLILAIPEETSPQLRDFFTVRHSWAWSNPGGWFGNGEDKWPWLDNYPQNPGWHGTPQNLEEISVSVAQHPTGNIGRSFHNGHEPPIDAYRLSPDRAKGIYFSDQFERALQVNPPFVFVTGWNEWIAQRFVSGPGGGPGFLGRSLKPGETFFVDEYTEEFSRDIEPMRDGSHGARGGHGDDYYYQLASFVRRYKGVRAIPVASAPRTIDPAKGFEQWETVGPEYRDDIGDTVHRDHVGWGKTTYADTSGRNDFGVMKVARDRKNLYFYVRAVDTITAPDTKTNWMTLLLDTDGDHKTGWEGYDYAVRRIVSRGREVTALCKSTGGWNWTPVTAVTVVRKGREMMITVPRASVELGPERDPIRFDFKWVDNVPDSGDILDFIDHGDVAPNGRFNYRYQE
jgi:hypothetical protein